MSRRRSRSSSAPQAQSGRVQSGQPAQQLPQQQQKSGGLFGWARRAGDWVGDQFNSATETVGGWIDDGVEVARDVADVVRTTSIGFENGALSITADADELMDLLPARLKQQFQLDRAGADNVFRIDIDRRNGRITFRSDELALSGIDLPEFGAGQTVARDVEIILSDRDGKLSLNGLTDINEYDIRVRVGGLDVTDLAMKDGLGRATTEVESTSISGLSFDATRDEQGQISADLAIDRAEAVGLTGDTAARSLTLSDVRGNLNEAAESASLDIGSITADQLQSEAGSGSGSANGLSVQIDNEGGGMPFFDDKADSVRARVEVSEAEVRGLDTEKLDAGFLSLAAASFDVDTVSKSVDGSFGSLEARDVEGPVSLDSASVRGGRISANAEKVSASVDEVDASGLDLSQVAKGKDEPRPENQPLIDLQFGKVNANDLTLPQGVSMGSVRADSLAVQAGGQGGAAVQANSVGIGDLRAGDTRVGSADVNGLDLTTRLGGDLNLGFGTASATDVSHGDLRVGSARATDGSVAKAGDVVNATVGQVSAQGVRAGDVSVGAVSVSDLAVGANLADKSVTGSTSGVTASGIRQGTGVSVDQLTTGAIQGGKDASGAISADVARLGIAGASVDGHRVGSADVQGAKFALDNGVGSASADRVHASGLDAAGAQVASLDARALSADWSGTQASARLGSATVAGVRSEHGDADQLSLSQLALGGDLARRTGSASVDNVTASGVRTAQGSVDALSLNQLGVQGDLAAGQVQAQLAAAQLDGVSSAQGGASKVTLSGLDASADLNKRSADVSLGAVDAFGVNAQGVRAGQVGARGVGVNYGSPDQIGFRADSLLGRDVNHNGETRIGAVDAHGLSGRVSQGSTQVGLGGLSASDISHRSALGGGGQGGGGVDMAALIRSGSQRVDNADLSVRGDMVAGRYGSGLSSMGIERGTALEARILVDQGRFQQGTGANLSKGIDTAAWTSVRGAYMDDGALKARVSGFFDLNASKHINGALGMRGNDLHSVAAYGDAIARQQGAPSTGSSGPSPLDTNSLRVQGQVGLSSGRIDTGSAQVDLDSRRAGSNTVRVNSAGGQSHVSVDRLIAAAIQVSEGGVQAAASGVEVDAARVALDQNGGNLQATIDAIRVGRIDLTTRR